MGMMMLSRLIMYLCGDYDSWDQRAMTIGMMGGMGGGMGGMGGGMGGMGGGMGGMGGGMRSVPPTSLPFANLKAGQTRKLPTRLVSLSPPDPDSETGVSLPAEGREAPARRRLPAQRRPPRPEGPEAAGGRSRPPSRVSQLVMWRLAGIDWAQIAQLSAKWANPHELTLAQEFVDRLDTLPDAETGTILFEIDAADDGGPGRRPALTKELAEKASWA